jgi:hypothetical protein
MAKIEQSEVTKFLNDIKYLVSGIQETILMGEDDFTENVSIQCEEIKKHIETFQVISLSVPVRNEPKRKYDYLEFYENQDSHIGMLTENGLTIEAEKKIFKATLYLHVKKRIKEKVSAEDLAQVPNDRLELELECATIDFGSPLEKQINDKFLQSAMLVFKNIADEIREERKKAPQQKLAL